MSSSDQILIRTGQNWSDLIRFHIWGVQYLMLGLYREQQGGEEVSRVGEGERGVNSAFSMCSAAV